MLSRSALLLPCCQKNACDYVSSVCQNTRECSISVIFRFIRCLSDGFPSRNLTIPLIAVTFASEETVNACMKEVCPLTDPTSSVSACELQRLPPYHPVYVWPAMLSRPTRGRMVAHRSPVA